MTAEPAAIDWSLLFDRPIVVVSDGRTFRGRMRSHTADTVTIVESNGAVSDLAKASITEAREDAATRTGGSELDDAPRRSSAARGTAGAEGDAVGFRRRGLFFHVSPGLLAAPLRGPSPVLYRWGFAIGGMIPAGSSFLGAYGFTFEHMVRKGTAQEVVFDPNDPSAQPEILDVDIRNSVFRGLAEVRLGSSSDRIFGYVLLGAGFAVVRAKVASSSSDLNSAAGGFSVPFGAGVQGLIGDHFLLGFEPRIVVDILGGAAAAMFDARLVLGAKF